MTKVLARNAVNIARLAGYHEQRVPPGAFIVYGRWGQKLPARTVGGWGGLADNVKFHTSIDLRQLAVLTALTLSILIAIHSVWPHEASRSPGSTVAFGGFRNDHIAFTEQLFSAPVDSRATPGPPLSATRVEPYLFLGGSKIPDAREVMERTGIKAFTLAFVLSDGGCRPAWLGTRPLTGNMARKIERIHATGAEIVVSFGGWGGHKLGQRCPNAQALAATYQQVIDTYRLRGIDIDIEHREFENPRVQDRVLRALKIVNDDNPDLTTIVTMPVTRNGLNSWGRRMVRRATQLQAPVDTWTIMPFVLGRPGANMARSTIHAAERTHEQIARYYPGLTAAEVYQKLGISTMNGDTGAGETITQDDFHTIRRYVYQRELGRFTFWAINRDRSCLDRGHRPCSGVPQHDWEFTKITSGRLTR